MRKFILLLLCCTSLYAVDVGKFILPVPEKYRDCISSGQGLREALDEKETGTVSTTGMYHYAIDWAVPDQTPVYAAKDGVVITCYPGYFNGGAEWKGEKFYGSCIVLQHSDGTQSMYAHLSRTDVKTGDTVRAGQQIALSGGVRGRRASGTSTGPHLHFCMLLNLKEFLYVGDEEN